MLIIITEVRVSLPLLRGLPKNPDSVSTNTPKSIASISVRTEESLGKLRACVVGHRVSLHGFDIESPDPIAQKAARYNKASITNFLTAWFGMHVVPLGQKASIIISNDASSSSISKLIDAATVSHRSNPSIIVLCSHTSRVERLPSPTNGNFSLGYVMKPVGPNRIGKAIAQCFEGCNPATPGVLERPSSTNPNDLSNRFEEMTLSPKGAELLDNSRMAADSHNARKAIESPTPNALVEKGSEFPFPIPSAENKTSLPKTKSLPGYKGALKAVVAVDGLPVSEVLTKIETAKVQTAEVVPLEPVPAVKYPSYLLVDDNAINLTLLSTSIKKRKYEVIDQAMDGLAAVKKFQEREVGYDVIFMDISMPLLDGFGATKEIRAIEESHKATLMGSQVDIASGGFAVGQGGAGGEKQLFKPALVIAITGLASSDDQARAASVGVDLFLTKPVSFRDVKKILDNWEANRLMDSVV
jgi:CheY-like chemotaxis protein